MKKSTIFLIQLLLFASACGAKNTLKTENQKNLQAQAEIWIDVRRPEEFATGHLDGALNIPHTVIAERISEVTSDKHQKIRLYCRSGRRSAIAKATLEKLGYTNVTNEGAYKDLKNQQ